MSSIAITSEERTKKQSVLMKFLIGGACTLLAESSVLHTLEMLKITKQTTNRPYPDIFRSLVEKKGLVGLWDGFLPWGVIQAIVKGAIFSMAQTFSLNMLKSNTTIDLDAAVIISGTMGGVVQGVFMSPLLLMKTRVISDPLFRSSGGLVATMVSSVRMLQHMLRVDGVAALTKGMPLMAFKRGVDWTSRFTTVVALENMIRRREERVELTSEEKMVAASLGGAISAIITLPFDTLLSTVQSSKNSKSKISSIQFVAQKMREEGILKTIRWTGQGLTIRVLHNSISTLVLKELTNRVLSYSEKSRKLE